MSIAPKLFVAFVFARDDTYLTSPTFFLLLVDTCPLPGAELEIFLPIGLGLLFKRPFVLTIGLIPRLDLGLAGTATKVF